MILVLILVIRVLVLVILVLIPVILVLILVILVLTLVILFLILVILDQKRKKRLCFGAYCSLWKVVGQTLAFQCE